MGRGDDMRQEEKNEKESESGRYELRDAERGIR